MYVRMYVCMYEIRRAEVKCNKIYGSATLVNRRNKKWGGDSNGMGNRI